MKKKIPQVFVTKPVLPSFEDYISSLKKIWESGIITNNGPFHTKLEEALTKYLGVDHISVFSNGTLALLSALQALDIKGEVITTPFSFVATTHALWWNKITPVFADIEPEYFTLDPGKIEKAITSQTSAILPVHVYGNPCKMEEIENIARKHKLKVIYDAAHAFGVEVNGESIHNYGDLSVLSFHATKVFNTVEGGAIVSRGEAMKKHIDHLKNFGFEDEVTVAEPGINAKMNELQAAYGLLQLNSIDRCIEKRKNITGWYRKLLNAIPGIMYMEDMPRVKHNYAYFPILVDENAYGIHRDELYKRLQEKDIYGRRYFYPLISTFHPYKELASANKENLPVSHNIASKILCLPIYPDLELSRVENIAEIISKNANK
jgi:dTDP-4-amino-4,6-dideoxygalactose transaminase